MKELEEIIEQRRKNLEAIRQMGIEPYPYRFEPSTCAQDILDKFSGIKPGEEVPEPEVSVAGRLISVRLHGKAGFAHVKDWSGQIQVYIRLDLLGEKGFELFRLIDLGDIIGVKGGIFKTRTGELTVMVKELTLLSKALRPMPEKWHGLKDIETRYRQRYLDLITNKKVTDTFAKRSRIIGLIREFLIQKGFQEVETPMMQPIPGGAAARPFITHHHALNLDLYLRVAPELYLKRLLIGGFERVFELNRNFRNEGISIKHNPEFTMLEVYQTFADYSDMMKLTEEMFAMLAEKITGSAKITYQGQEINLSPPWQRMTMYEAIKKYAGIDVQGKSPAELKKICREKNLEPDEWFTAGEAAGFIFEELVESKLIQPVFITDYPEDLSPLAKRKRGNPGLVERFEPYIFGREMGNAFSELNDPEDQRKRFMEQAKKREAGFELAQVMDEDFLSALEYGMPPAAGLGIGVDRLVMLLTDSASIRDVIFFPQLRPKSSEAHGSENTSEEEQE